MSPLITVTTAVSIGLLAATLAGALSRRQYRACYTFPLYLAAVLIGDSLTFFWPERFYVWGFWMLRETSYGALKLAIAIEIARLASTSFPGAAATMRNAVLTVLAVGFASIIGALGADPGIAALARDVQPRLAQTTALTFSAVWGLVLWYHLPLHRLHRAILRGLVPYLLVFTVARGLIMSLGWNVWPGANAADALSYVAMLVYWTWEAWRPTEADSVFLRDLQPWRSRL